MQLRPERRSSTRPPTGRRSRRRGPSTPSNGDDPAYQLADLDELVFHVGPARPARDDQRHRDAEVGERQQDAEPPADAPLRPDDVHEDARDAVQRPHGPRHGRALVGLERAEHPALPDAAVLGQEDRRPGELREALQGGVRGHQGRQPACEGRDRRDVGARPRQAAQRRQRQRRAGHVREAARQGERPQVRRVGASPVSRRRRTCRRCRRCATRT